ncbi:MAG: MotA/TolQ/ExbB proton channel family protein, partial [Bacteroidota bacterium]
MYYGIVLQIVDSTSGAIASTSTSPAAEQSISLWDMAQKGGPILIPIAILSMAAVYIFFERYFTIRRLSNIDMNFMNQIKDHVHSGNIDAAR